jgi:hypothetical protein
MAYDWIPLRHAKIDIMVFTTPHCFVPPFNRQQAIASVEGYRRHSNQILAYECEVRISGHGDEEIGFNGMAIFGNCSERTIDESTVGLLCNASESCFERSG